MDEERGPVASRAANVLVVYDETEPRQAVALLLSSAGFQVTEAAGSEDAERALGSDTIGIVLVDGDMPGVDGFELCRRIRRAHGSNVYIILRTTKDRLASGGLNVDEGAEDFLLEPVADAEILARVEAGRKMRQLQEKLEETNKSLAILEVTDPLTGAYNRQKIDVEMKREMERSRRYSRPMSVVMLDLDGFRLLNDRLGRAAGDRVLEEMARILKLSTRTTDSVGRYGGEEFVVLLPETPKDQALGAAEKMRKIIEQTAIAIGDRTVHVTVSAGIATQEDNRFETADQLAGAAAAAVARAKTAGRNRCDAS